MTDGFLFLPSCRHSAAFFFTQVPIKPQFRLEISCEIVYSYGMKKIVINSCYGGFELSEFAAEQLGVSTYDAEHLRDSEELVALIETYGSQAISGECAKLKIIKIPDNATGWTVEEYDGKETLIYY